MTELPKIFENAKVGDNIFCTRRGWLKIREINEGSIYPINTKYSSYMLDGRYLEDDKAPSVAYHWNKRDVSASALANC